MDGGLLAKNSIGAAFCQAGFSFFVGVHILVAIRKGVTENFRNPFSYYFGRSSVVIKGERIESSHSILRLIEVEDIIDIE